jgi:hypothetical protein
VRGNDVADELDDEPQETVIPVTVMLISLLKLVIYTLTAPLPVVVTLEKIFTFAAWHAAEPDILVVCVLVNVVNHTERIAPTATVKPIKRTVATKELIAFFIIFHLN